MIAGPLHADARRVLHQWTAPDAAQDRLRDAYVAHLDTYADAVLRDCRAGHITASTIIIDPACASVLLTLHPIVGRWLQTGGHCEPDDATLLAAAAREAAEESSIGDLVIDEIPVRLDRHAVRCRADDGGVTVLDHLDVQFVALAPPHARERRTEESVDLRWWAWDRLPEGIDDSVRALVAAALDRQSG